MTELQDQVKQMRIEGGVAQVAKLAGIARKSEHRAAAEAQRAGQLQEKLDCVQLEKAGRPDVLGELSIALRRVVELEAAAGRGAQHDDGGMEDGHGD